MDDTSRVSAWMQALKLKTEKAGNAFLRGTGLTVMQLRVLKYLKKHPEESQIADISEFFGVTHPSAIHVVDALEEKGYVRREPIRRSRGKRIVLTEQGERLAEENEDTISKVEERMMEGISGEDKEKLLGLLRRMDANLDRLLEEESDPGKRADGRR